MSNRADPQGVRIADNHYSRKKPGTPQFTGNGSTVTLLAPIQGDPLALWVTKWQKYVRTEWWLDAWVCSLFRNQGAGLSSELITEAVAATCAVWGAPPPRGFVTLVDAGKTAARRGKRNAPGHCYLKAGWVEEGVTDGGLIVLRLPTEAFPIPSPPHEFQMPLIPQQRDWRNALSSRVRSGR